MAPKRGVFSNSSTTTNPRLMKRERGPLYPPSFIQSSKPLNNRSTKKSPSNSNLKGKVKQNTLTTNSKPNLDKSRPEFSKTTIEQDKSDLLVQLHSDKSSIISQSILNDNSSRKSSSPKRRSMTTTKKVSPTKTGQISSNLSKTKRTHHNSFQNLSIYAEFNKAATKQTKNQDKTNNVNKKVESDKIKIDTNIPVEIERSTSTSDSFEPIPKAKSENKKYEELNLIKNKLSPNQIDQDEQIQNFNDINQTEIYQSQDQQTNQTNSIENSEQDNQIVSNEQDMKIDLNDKETKIENNEQSNQIDSNDKTNKIENNDQGNQIDSNELEIKIDLNDKTTKIENNEQINQIDSNEQANKIENIKQINSNEQITAVDLNKDDNSANGYNHHFEYENENICDLSPKINIPKGEIEVQVDIVDDKQQPSIKQFNDVSTDIKLANIVQFSIENQELFDQSPKAQISNEYIENPLIFSIAKPKKELTLSETQSVFDQSQQCQTNSVQHEEMKNNVQIDENSIFYSSLFNNQSNTLCLHSNDIFTYKEEVNKPINLQLSDSYQICEFANDKAQLTICTPEEISIVGNDSNHKSMCLSVHHYDYIDNSKSGNFSNENQGLMVNKEKYTQAMKELEDEFSEVSEILNNLFTMNLFNVEFPAFH